MNSFVTPHQPNIGWGSFQPNLGEQIRNPDQLN